MESARAIVLGCGYLGSALVRRLVDAGHDCAATTTTPARVELIRSLETASILLDLSDVGRLHESIRDRDVVYLTVAVGRSGDYRRVYLDGARNLMHAVLGTSVRRIIYTSSTSVYSQDDGRWVDEDSPTEPATDNGRALVDAERCLLIESAAAGIVATVLRLGGIVGPGRDPAERVAQFAGTQRDDGDVYVNLIQRDDAVSAMVRLLDVAYHGVLNLCDGAPVLRRDYYDRLIAAAGLEPIRWVSTRSTPGGKRIRSERIKLALM